jgi:hypothetical protein
MQDEFDRSDRDIHDAIKDERRTNKPSSKESHLRREREQMIKDVAKAFRERNERGISAALKRAGILDGSDEWTRIWKAYRAYCGK